jgi:VWFA-related protein
LGIVAKALAFAVILLIAPGGSAQCPEQPPSSAEDPETLRFSVNVDLVLLHATVRDRDGLFVSDLREQDFQVYEDGVRQRIRLFKREDTPVTVGLLIDHSGSMRPKLNDVITAARTFAQASNPEDEMFIVNFNEFVTLGLPISTPFTNDPNELERAISKTPADGQTALYDAIGEALSLLQRGRRAKKVLIVISDGGDNASRRTLDQVLVMAGQSSAIIYTIGTFDAEDEDANPRVLRRLARTTGGEAFFPEHHQAVVEICERIANDIRNQYILGYVSTNPSRNGTYRAMRVVAKAPRLGKLSVRTRAGYIAGGDSAPAAGGGTR